MRNRISSKVQGLDRVSEGGREGAITENRASQEVEGLSCSITVIKGGSQGATGIVPVKFYKD